MLTYQYFCLIITLASISGWFISTPGSNLHCQRPWWNWISPAAAGRVSLAVAGHLLLCQQMWIVRGKMGWLTVCQECRLTTWRWHTTDRRFNGKGPCFCRQGTGFSSRRFKNECKRCALLQEWRGLVIAGIRRFSRACANAASWHRYQYAHCAGFAVTVVSPLTSCSGMQAM